MPRRNMFFEELWEKVEGDLTAIRLDHDEEIGDVVIAALMGDSRLRHHFGSSRCANHWRRDEKSSPVCDIKWSMGFGRFYSASTSPDLR